MQLRVLIKQINQLTKQGLPLMNSTLVNFAREISGKKSRKNWASHQIKVYLDKVISCSSAGLDLDRKKVDSVFKYTLYFKLIGQKIK